MPNGLIAYNPTAGRYPSRILVERAAAILEKHGWTLELVRTEGGEHIRALAHQAAEQDLDAFFMAGGDGSLNWALQGLIGRRTALAVLPCGSSNVWSQELGLPGLSWTRWGALEESANRLAEGYVRCVDIGQSGEHPFLLWAGVGLDAFVIHRIEPRSAIEKRFAMAHYAASIFWHAADWNGINLSIHTDGDQIEGHFLVAVLSNVQLYAGGIARLSPESRLDDGRMEIWLFEGDTLGDAVQRTWDLWAGRHIDSKFVHHLAFHHLRIESQSQLYLQVDGEPVQAASPIEVWVRPKALNILAPAQVPFPIFSQPPQSG
jgi:diacylglycerol kinase (ATP)